MPWTMRLRLRLVLSVERSVSPGTGLWGPFGIVLIEDLAGAEYLPHLALLSSVGRCNTPTDARCCAGRLVMGMLAGIGVRAFSTSDADE